MSIVVSEMLADGIVALLEVSSSYPSIDLTPIIMGDNVAVIRSQVLLRTGCRRYVPVSST